MSEDYKIEKGIPMPERRGNKYSTVLKKMKVGDSVVLPAIARASIYTCAAHQGMHVVARAVDSTTIRVWRDK